MEIWFKTWLLFFVCARAMWCISGRMFQPVRGWTQCTEPSRTQRSPAGRTALRAACICPPKARVLSVHVTAPPLPPCHTEEASATAVNCRTLVVGRCLWLWLCVCVCVCLSVWGHWWPWLYLSPASLPPPPPPPPFYHQPLQPFMQSVWEIKAHNTLSLFSVSEEVERLGTTHSERRTKSLQRQILVKRSK